MKITKTEYKLCLCCMEEHEVHQVEIMEKTKVQVTGVEVEYLAKYEYCEITDCIITYDNTMDENLISFQNAYAKKTKTCRVKGCDNEYYAKGLCKFHYERFRRTVRNDTSCIREICTVEGCDRAVHAKGYCKLHYDRIRANKTTDAPKHPQECSVEGCTEKYRAKGLCKKHYDLQTYYRKKAAKETK